MSYVVGVPYYAITADDYDFLVELMGAEFMTAQGFAPYSAPDGNTYYLTLQSEIDETEAANLAAHEFPTTAFGIAYFTTSVQANITFPGAG